MIKKEQFKKGIEIKNVKDSHSFKIVAIENGYAYTDKGSVMPIDFYLNKHCFILVKGEKCI